MLRQAFVRRSLCAGKQLLSIQQKRGYDCPPAPMPKCKPCCEIPRPRKPPCCTPLQPQWTGCDKICLPCCEKICVPFVCKEGKIGLVKCKKEEYRLPSYTECTKLQRRPAYKKECCYNPFACHVDSIAAKEVRMLIPIKERQRRVLLSRIKSS